MFLSYTLSKKERLCSKKSIDYLFANGKSTISYPLRMQYLLVDEVDDVAVKILVSVPKKRFKRAVHRNLIKRRVKEAYRLNKHELTLAVEEGKTLLVAYIYLTNEIVLFPAIEKAIKKGIEKLKPLISS